MTSPEERTGDNEISIFIGLDDNRDMNFLHIGHIRMILPRYLSSSEGDHVNIKMPNGQIITIPVSKELKIGLLKAAIRKAGLSEEAFVQFLS